MIIWSDYIKYRIRLREFDASNLENILYHSTERYFDNSTYRNVVVGKHKKNLIIIPYEIKEEDVFPITVHVITRQQINFRLKTGRFNYE